MVKTPLPPTQAEMPLTPTQSLARALVNLRNLTQGTIARGTRLRKENLSVWLRGGEKVISEKRQVKIMRFLGVNGKRLRTDLLHKWEDSGNLEFLKLAMEQLGEGQSITLYQDGSGLPKCCFLQVGESLIRLSVLSAK